MIMSWRTDLGRGKVFGWWRAANREHWMEFVGNRNLEEFMR